MCPETPVAPFVAGAGWPYTGRVHEGHADTRGRGRLIRSGSILTALLAAALALAGCWGEPSGAVEARSNAPARALTVSVAPVEALSVERTVDATGSLLAWQEVVLNTSARGTVARLLVDLGDRVQAGQVVAELDPRELALTVDQAEAGAGAARDALQRALAQVEASRAQLEQVRDSRRSLEAGLNHALAALEETRTNLERMRTLVQESLVAQRDLDVARTQYEAALGQHQTAQVALDQYPSRVRVAEAQLASDRSAVRVAEADLRRREAELALTRKKLADATLTAPIGGAIARRHLNPGQFVTEDTPVFTIVRTHPLKFTGTVAEHAALEIQPGQVVRLRAEVAGGRAVAGRVTRVSPSVDVASRTVLIEAEVPNPDGLLKPGLFARGLVVIRQDPDIAFVPEAAVSYFAGLTRVFVVADGAARQRPVTLGTRRDGLIEVVTGVRPGEQVATSGLAQLQDGAPVTPAAPAPEQAGTRAPGVRR